MTDTAIIQPYPGRPSDIVVPMQLRADDSTIRLHFWFIACHLIWGLLAAGFAMWLYTMVEQPAPAFWVFLALTTSLLAQPLLFRLLGTIELLSCISVLILNVMVIIAVYYFGGYLSPALPFSIVIPLFCLFFLNKLGQIAGLSTLAAGYGLLVLQFGSGHELPRQLSDQQLAGPFLFAVITAALSALIMARAYLEQFQRSRDSLHAETARHWDTAQNLARTRNLVDQTAMAKGRSIAAICGEIRLPLNAIIGFAQIISRELMGKLSDDRYRSCASDIESSGMHLLGIIDEVMDLARVQTGDLELSEVDIDLNELVGNSREATIGLAQARKVDISVNLPKDVMTVRADKSRLQQIVIALLSNAIVLVSGGGRLHVQLSRTAAGEILLLLRARGSRVSPQRLAMAMEPFSETPGGDSSERLGVGYGLPIARRLILLHGGSLDVGGPKPDEIHIIMKLPADRLQ